MSRLKAKGQDHQGQKNEKLLTMHSKACATAPYAARSSRLYHCVAAGGDRVTAVHADGDLRGGPRGLASASSTPVGKSAHDV